MTSSFTKKDILLDAIRPRANANFWGPQVATPGALPATGKPGEVRQVLDDGDGKSAVYSWTNSAWTKIADPDLLLGGDMTAAVYDPTAVAGDAFARTNHTGTQLASTISDFDATVAEQATVLALGVPNALLTFYVDQAAGNDTTGDGQVGTPWATLAKALGAVRYLRVTGDHRYVTINLVAADGTDGVDPQISYQWPNTEQDHHNLTIQGSGKLSKLQDLVNTQTAVQDSTGGHLLTMDGAPGWTPNVDLTQSYFARNITSGGTGEPISQATGAATFRHASSAGWTALAAVGQTVQVYRNRIVLNWGTLNEAGGNRPLLNKVAFNDMELGAQDRQFFPDSNRTSFVRCAIRWRVNIGSGHEVNATSCIFYTTSTSGARYGGRISLSGCVLSAGGAGKYKINSNSNLTISEVCILRNTYIYVYTGAIIERGQGTVAVAFLEAFKGFIGGGAGLDVDSPRLLGLLDAGIDFAISLRGGGEQAYWDSTSDVFKSDGVTPAEVSVDWTISSSEDYGTHTHVWGFTTHSTDLSDPISLTFAADAGNTIEERVGFPFALSEVEDIHVGPIGVKGTGTITFAKGMQGGTNILTAASYDVSTATDNTMVSVGALSATPANYQGGVLDVVLISMINCSVPHLVKITFKRQ